MLSICIKILMLALFAVALSACSVKPVTPLTPYSLGADGLVLLENTCEDPVIDQVTLSPLEATADLLAMPAQMIAWTARLGAYIVIGVPAAYMGKDMQATIDQINYVIPWPSWGPNPDRVAVQDILVLDGGCL